MILAAHWQRCLKGLFGGGGGCRQQPDFHVIHKRAPYSRDPHRDGPPLADDFVPPRGPPQQFRQEGHARCSSYHSPCTHIVRAVFMWVILLCTLQECIFQCSSMCSGAHALELCTVGVVLLGITHASVVLRLPARGVLGCRRGWYEGPGTRPCLYRRHPSARAVVKAPTAQSNIVW